MARCLALVGMVSTHVLAERDPDGSLALGQAVSGGRAAALFAVLAGVGLALSTGRTVPLRGRERWARSAGVAVRAVAIAVLGLALGGLDSGLAVILTYYGVLFLLALPFLGLTATPLVAIAAVWSVAAPLASHLVRPHLPPRGFDSPGLGHLDDPARLLSELLLTGYYPAVPWLTYLLVGLAVGRLDLTRRLVQVVVVALGCVLAVAATAVSHLLVSRPAVRAALLDGGGPPASTADALLEEIAVGMFGTTPTGGPWEWLLVVAPHSATPFDLVQTSGSAVAVLGAALVVAGLLGEFGRRALAVVFGAGAMTLSLYSLHVLLRTPEAPPPDTPEAFPAHVLVLLVIGAVFAAAERRGPLEWVVHRASTGTAAWVRRAGT